MQLEDQLRMQQQGTLGGLSGAPTESGDSFEHDGVAFREGEAAVRGA